MAAHWSNENVSVGYFRESQATAMAVDVTGEFALLAGRRGLDLISLDKLDHPGIQSRIKRKGMMKWDISVVEWNPHYGRHREFVTASNQVADLYVKREGDWFQQHSLKAHTRAISDLNWSVFEPDLLATCSVDTYIYLWDTREPQKPSLSFSTFAGAAQVKWNKRNSNYLATVHEGDIRLWDKRKCSQAVQYVSASLGKIHGLDWEPSSEFFLVTASQDCTAKFWDVRDPKKTVLELRTNSPLWRARYTPFGDGLVTATVPQLRRGEKSLLLWSQSNPVGPIHSFTGHKDDVLDFQWRTQKQGSSDFQLITWSRDHSLRIWSVEPHLQKLCGVDVPDPVSPQDPLISSFEVVGTPKDAQTPLNGISSSGGTPVSTQGPLAGSGAEIGSPETPSTAGFLASGSYSQPTSVLEQEFAAMKLNLPNVTIQKMDIEGQFCTVTAFSHHHIIIMKVIFPPSYPEKATPKLVFLPATTLDSTVKHKLLKILEDTCLRQMENNKLCLEACLQQLSVSIDGMKLTSEIPSQLPKPPASSSYKQTSSLPSTYGSHLDGHIPFPRTSGARFSGVDKLVVFLRPGTIKKSHTTPRALSSLSMLNLLRPLSIGQGPSSQSPAPEALPSLLRNFYKEREKKQRRGGKYRRKTSSSDPTLASKASTANATPSSLVVLYSAVGLTPVHQELAEKYQFISDNIPLMCTLNAEAAAAVGRTDLVQVWSLAALSNSSELRPDSDADKEMPWAQHPFGRQLLQTLFDHYSSLHDVQTLAMLSCAFGSVSIRPSLPAGSDSQSQDVQSYLVTDSTDPIFTKGWSHEKCSQAVSFSESPDDYRFGENRDPEQIEKEQHHLSTRLLEPCLTTQFDAFKRSYADILYQWRLLHERAQVLNYVACPSHTNIDFSFSDFGVVCQKCGRPSYKVQCEHCHSYSFQCSICHTAVKGSSSFCLACGHGGHTSHILGWFKIEDVCPTGCGCQCQINSQLVCERSPLPTDPVVTR